MKCRKISFITFTLYFIVNLNLTETPSSIVTTNSIVTFFVGVAATLVVVLVVLVLIRIHKRRRQAPKLSTGVLKVDTIEMQDGTSSGPSQNNQVYITCRGQSEIIATIFRLYVIKPNPYYRNKIMRFQLMVKERHATC